MHPEPFGPIQWRVVYLFRTESCGHHSLIFVDRQGWIEAPYATVPCAALTPGRLVRPQLVDARLSVHVVPGLKQETPADVMRGEETQIAGFLAQEPQFDGVLCLPGTHTKWVRVSAGEVVSFQTFMTGEMFALLSGQSVLRHGTAGDGWDAAAFAAGLDQALSRPALCPAGVLHHLAASACCSTPPPAPAPDTPCTQ